VIVVVMGVTAENVHAVGAVEVLGGEGLSGRTTRDEFPVDEEDLVEKRLDAFEVVVRGDDEFARVPEPTHGGGEGLGGIAVEAGEWLVEEINFGVLRPSAGKEGPLLLTSREGGNLAVGEIFEVTNI
jgi:hypothetical protein